MKTNTRIIALAICAFILGAMVLTFIVKAIPDSQAEDMAAICESTHRYFDYDSLRCDITPKAGPTNIKYWSGVISSGGGSSYMYGSHELYGQLLDHNRKTVGKKRYFALRSSTENLVSWVNLDLWEGKSVIIKGYLVPNYPVDGGPPYIMVDAVEAR